MQKSPLIVGLCFTVVVFTIGCVAPVVNTSKLQYQAPEFSEVSLEGDGLSLLPVVAGAGQEGLRRPLAENLQKYLTSELPEKKFNDHLQTMDLINNADLAEDYAKLIEGYNTSAILNKTTLKAIGQTIGVRYLLYVKLQDQSQSSGLQYGVLSGRMVSTLGRNVYIFGQVWDSDIGDVVWEGTGEIAVQSSELTYVKESIEELVDMAARSFLNNLPGVNIPDPKPQITSKRSKNTSGKTRPKRY